MTSKKSLKFLERELKIALGVIYNSENCYLDEPIKKAVNLIKKDLEVLEILKRMLNDPQGYVAFEFNGVIDVTTSLNKEESKLLTDWLSEVEDE